MTATLRELESALHTIAPLRYAEDWDNVGLLIGGRDWSISHVMFTIDLTDAVLAEAIEHGANAIVAYHPPIFSAFKSLTDSTTKQRIALLAAANRIGIYSPHTALDAAPNGVNDWLAKGFGSGDVRALRSHGDLPTTEQCKVVTFAPADAVEKIRNGLASIGAGHIGDYELCSFELKGRGTFRGGESTNPTVGQAGALETADETRLEMVCPREALGLAVQILRQFHPYEEPPIEIYALQPRPQRQIGAGRRVMLDRKATIEDLAQRIKKHLGIDQVRIAIGTNAPQKYSAVGICAGAGGSLLDDVIANGCEVYLTGEMNHHTILDAQSRGCSVILAGHTNTERGFLPTLQKRLEDTLPSLSFSISQVDAHPLQVM